MPINIDLLPYTLESVISSDGFYTHYAAGDSEGGRYSITEFFPAQMVSRTAAGEVKTDVCFFNDYHTALEQFMQGAKAMQALCHAPLIRMECVMRRNNTAYIIRQQSTLPTLETYLHGERLSYTDAYALINPLIAGLSNAAKKGLTFTFSKENLRVNETGTLILDGLFTWPDRNSGFSAPSETINIFYWLITGRDFEPERAFPSSLGITLPLPLENRLMDILTEKTVFASWDDLHKNFSYIIALPVRKETSCVSADAVPSVKIMRIAVFGLSLLLVSTIIFLLVYQATVPVYNRTSSPTLAYGPSPTPTSVSPIPAYLSDCSAYAFCDPQNPHNRLNGAFCEKDGVLYYRAYDDGYVLAKQRADGKTEVLLSNVRPADIIVHEEYVYFSDGLADYKIFRVSTAGGDVEAVSQNSASFLCINGNTLYYTNHSARDYLYQINLTTNAESPLFENAGYAIGISGDRLYFINGSQQHHIYTLTLRSEEQVPDRLTPYGGDHAGLYHNTLFYIEPERGEIRCATLEGRPIAFSCPLTVYGFAVNGPWMVIIEADTYHLFAYHMDTGTLLPISDARFAYVYLSGSTIYAMDYANVQHIYQMPLPTLPVETETTAAEASESEAVH